MTEPELDAYTSSLRKSMDEKLFFADRLPKDVDMFVDFGCADGSLLRDLGKRRYALILGYDRNADMVERSRANGVYAYGDLEEFRAVVQRRHSVGFKSCLILSSVCHEFLTEHYEHQLWQLIDSFGCEYVAIRDMGVSEEAYRTPYLPKYFETLSIRGCRHLFRLETRKDLIECFLKYRYDSEREYSENYLPLPVEAYLEAAQRNHRLLFWEHAGLPHLQRQWMQDVGFELNDPTHFKMLLQRKA